MQFGLTQDEVQKRLTQLSDRQIHQIALQLDDLKIGQDDVLAVIIALLFIAILVVVLLKLTGHKVIVTK
jgi:urease accessory protein UreE